MFTCFKFLTQYYLFESLFTSTKSINRSFFVVFRVDSVRTISTRSNVSSKFANLLFEIDHQKLFIDDFTFEKEQIIVLILEILNDSR